MEKMTSAHRQGFPGTRRNEKLDLLGQVMEGSSLLLGLSQFHSMLRLVESTGTPRFIASFFFFNFFFGFVYLFVCLFIYGCVGSSFLCEGFL